MRVPWYRRRIDRVLATGRAEAAIPAGTLIYTPAGRKSHVKAALTEGALCPDLADWPGPWLGTGSDGEREYAAVLPRCPKCAVRGERAAAS